MIKIVAIQDGHNASLAYMEEGEVKFAIQEERLTRIKNTAGFPELALQELLQRHQLHIRDVDIFVFTDALNTGGWKKGQGVEYLMQKHRNLFEERKLSPVSFLRTAQKSLVGFLPSPVFGILQERKRAEFLERRMKPLLDLGVSRSKIKFFDHHLCHAASAAYGWGLGEKLVVITSDGAGDNLSGSVSVLEGGVLKRLALIPVEDSIARLYALITYYLGMVPLEHEYKVMGLAPYAQDSRSARELCAYFKKFFLLNDDGLTYHRSPGIEATYKLGPRLTRDLKFYRFDHIAAGLQLFVEEFVTEWVHNILGTLKISNLALSGGLFMNVKLNKKIMELEGVKKLFVFPSCGDESNVFGGLYLAYQNLTGKVPQPLRHLYLGGDFSDKEVEKSIRSYAFRNAVEWERPENVERKIAELLAGRAVVARFDGKMEFGARALGNRSILADPREWGVVKEINRMIKSRDFWMPFAPSCIELDRYVENPKCVPAPFMILTFDVKEGKVDKLAAALHPYDNTCRPQEVSSDSNPSYFRIISEFERLTGEGIILNTSFNLHGHPIVYTPEDALHVFDNSGLRYLVLGPYLLKKK
ncbi:MAG: carbamoyltransferase [Candidatus Sungiibacteriota bacterium]|uniref:Carbamoyltransferase n=1 Tax=Candidatus Sungiibacteriota bacterium TaxID=2750080 RepID=A0A7T5UQ44_9BACT|nr:MAG: carbamoyltransferase [Candidatus Sungbacteria bacterium]